MSDEFDQSDNGNDETANSHYEVGYGKPPQNTRFKPGQSGNRKGRPKGTISLMKAIRGELNEKIEITENGEEKTLTKAEVIAKKLCAALIKGDHKMLMQGVKYLTTLEENEQQRLDRKSEKSVDNERCQGGVLLVPAPILSSTEFVEKYKDLRVPEIEYDDKGKMKVPWATIVDE